MFAEIEDFLSPKAFEILTEYRKTATFEDVTCPEDGVTYPHICMELPDIVCREVAFRAGAQPTRLFLRASPWGVHVPHPVHHDGAMGGCAMMLYLDAGPKTNGTMFLRHTILGVSYAPRLPHLIEQCAADTAEDIWQPTVFCRAAPNKACIFDAGYFHRAEPTGGYGEGAEARCVLTGFFP